MKKLLTILCLVLLVSCSNEVPDDQLVERQGIQYEVNSTTPFTGSSVSYHENGQLEIRGNYKDGENDGLFEWFYENGQLKERRNFKKGKQDGLWEYFDKYGNLTRTSEYKDGELVLYQTFDQEGKPLNNLIFTDGEKTGVGVAFHDDGDLGISVEKGNWIDGKKDGFFETFWENGQIQSKENYQDGELEGIREFYNIDGILVQRDNYKSGKRNGITECFSSLYNVPGESQSPLVCRINYKDGKEDGLSEWFDKDGNITKSEEYKDGELIE